MARGPRGEGNRAAEWLDVAAARAATAAAVLMLSNQADPASI